MKKQINILTYFSFILLFHTISFAGERIQVLDEAIKAMQPFTCEFSQEYYDAFQDKKAISKGRLSFMQPGLMKWNYETPEEMLFIIGREKIWLYDPLLENVTIQELSHGSGIRSLRFLSGDEQLNLLFKETVPKKLLVSSNTNDMVITLTPKKKNQALAELQLVFDLTGNKLVEFVLIDYNFNYRKIVLSETKPDFSLKESDFQFLVTEDIEVIEGINN